MKIFIALCTRLQWLALNQGCPLSSLWHASNYFNQSVFLITLFSKDRNPKQMLMHVALLTILVYNLTRLNIYVCTVTHNLKGWTPALNLANTSILKIVSEKKVKKRIEYGKYCIICF